MLTPIEAVRLGESMTPDDQLAMLLALDEVAASAWRASREHLLTGNDPVGAEFRAIAVKCSNVLAAIRSHAPKPPERLERVLVERPTRREEATLELAKDAQAYGPKVCVAGAVLAAHDETPLSDEDYLIGRDRLIAHLAACAKIGGAA